MAVGLALGGVAIARTQSVGAHPQTTPYSLNCTLSGVQLAAVTTDITTEHDPLTLIEGEPVTLNVKTTPPQGIAIDVPVTRVVITIPVPAQVDTSVPPTVAISGGNLTGSGAVQGGNLVVTLTGNVSSTALQIPELNITSQLKSGIAGQTINWGGPTKLDITANVPVLGQQLVSCAATTTDPVAVTPVHAAGGPTTTHGDHDHGGHGHDTTTTTDGHGHGHETTTTTDGHGHGHETTTTAGPTTTAPVTTRPVTTTTDGHGHGHETTTTTRSTTTSRPATTRPPQTTRPTRPPTTQRPGGGFFDLIRRVICFIFRFAC